MQQIRTSHITALRPRPAAVTSSAAAIVLLLAAAPTQAQTAASQNSSSETAADTPSSATATVTVTDTPVVIGQQPDDEGLNDYRVTRSPTGAKADIPTKDIPQSVISVPQKVLEEQNVQTLNEALRNVAGVQATNSNLQGAGQWMTTRGFQNRNFYKDGLRDDTFDRTYWLGNVERIEVLKGPASVLYGDGSLGGAINVVSKKPLPQTSVSGSLWGGTDQSVGIGTDVSGKLNDSGSVLVRLIADKSQKDTFVDNYSYDAQHASILLQALAGERTTITLAGEFRDRSTDGNYSGTPAYARSYGVDNSTNYNADWSGRNDTGANLSARLRHEFNNDWKVNTGLMLNRYDFDQTLTSASFSAAQAALNRVGLSGNKTDSTTKEIISDTNLEGSFHTWGLRHQSLVGVEAFYSTIDRLRFGGTLPTTFVSLWSPATNFGEPNWAENLHIKYTTQRRAIYAQDLLELTPQLKVMAGLRFDDVEKEQKNLRTLVTSASHDAEWSKRAGVTYEVVPGVTAFGGYSHSFVPPGDENTTSLGTLPDADPEIGQQYEGGVKLDLADSFTATAAVYQLKRQNVRTTDSVTQVTSIVGEQQSTGFEFDATWKVAPGWNLLAAYAYNDAHVTKDNKYTEGAQLVNAPAHSARLWSMYEVQAGDLAGFGFGGGLTYVGKRAASLVNNYYIPEYVTADLAAYYKFNENAKFSLNANNIFNQDYYVASSGDDNPMLYTGEPMSLVGRLQVTF